jgi:hypothetical protein
MTYLEVRILVPARRDVAAICPCSGPELGLRLLFVNHCKAYSRGLDGNWRRATGDLMKIYLLMALISAIAVLSHLRLDRKAPEGEA